MPPSQTRKPVSKKVSDPKSWRSWQLRSWWMISIISLHAGFIATIAALLRISQTQSGFVDVQQTQDVNTFSDLFSTKIWTSQFRWTLLPGLLMSLLAMGYGTMVTASAQRQPFVELIKRKKAKSAKLTILLDYSSQPALYRWVIALRNHHLWLGLAMLVQLAAAIAIGPLGSNLFKTKGVTRSVPIALGSPLGFDLGNIGGNTNPGTSIEIANAVHVDGAAPPRWTTDRFAISPFVATSGSLSGLVTAVTDVYYANLDCRLIPREQLNAAFFKDLADAGNLQINFTDRGCKILDQSFVVGAASKYYARAWEQDCQGFAPFTDRFGVFMGTYAASSPDDLSQLITVSCIPSYHSATASVEMDFEGDGAPVVDSVNIINSSKLISLNFRGFESSVPGYTIFDLSPSINSNSFGQTVYEYASKLSSTSAPDGSAALDATQAVYTTMFAALTQGSLFSRRQQTQPVNGMQSLTSNRLYVVPPVAYVLLALLGLMLICSIGLFALARGRESILRGEPQGLLGSANVLFESNIFQTIRDYYAQTSHPPALVKYVKKHYSIKEATCWYAEPAQTNAAAVNSGAVPPGQVAPGGVAAPAQGGTGRGTAFIHVEDLKERSTSSPPNVMRRLWNRVKKLWN